MVQLTTHPNPAFSGVMPAPMLVPVQRQARLEPQRVACAQTGGLHAGADDLGQNASATSTGTAALDAVSPV